MEIVVNIDVMMARRYLGEDPQRLVGIPVTVYVGSVFAWITLAQLWRLLGNLRQGLVFTRENVRLLRIVSWCCVGAAIVCLLSLPWLWFLPVLVVAAAAGFMAMIVRIVKNVFQQAIAMKDELDLTV